MNSLLLTDGYKLGHHLQYPIGTSLVFSNLTPRSDKHAPEICRGNGVVVAGTQKTFMEINEHFNENFFKLPKEQVIAEAKKEISTYLGLDYDTKHFEDLHDLGYLPVTVRALDEGSICPIGVPMLIIWNTRPEFYWLTNYLETILSCLLWKPMTSATIAHVYKKTLLKWAKLTDETNVGFVEFQGHDFSMRGMDSIDATISSDMGHLMSFSGTESLPVLHGIRKIYGDEGFIAGTVPATEHSVMCAGGKEDELETFERLLNIYPEGTVSVVSDTWDLWNVLTIILPRLKDKILARKGKLVIRPDSGDPADILCGILSKKTKKEKYFISLTEEDIKDNEFDFDYLLENPQEYLLEHDLLPSMCGGRDYSPDCKEGETCKILLGNRIFAFEVYTGDCIEATWSHTINKTDIKNFREIEIEEVKQDTSPITKGVIELLWDVFGGHVNAQGYKVLDPHIGAIYGDSITPERADEICRRLAEKGFASTNVILGIGSYTYQFNTRDTFGFAVKATYIEKYDETCEKCEDDPTCSKNGNCFVGFNIFKDPVTDSGIKKSAKGLLSVVKDETGKLVLKQECTWEDVESEDNLLKPIFKDGELLNKKTFAEVRKKLSESII